MTPNWSRAWRIWQFRLARGSQSSPGLPDGIFSYKNSNFGICKYILRGLAIEVVWWHTYLYIWHFTDSFKNAFLFRFDTIVYSFCSVGSKKKIWQPWSSRPCHIWVQLKRPDSITNYRKVIIKSVFKIAQNFFWTNVLLDNRIYLHSWLCICCLRKL
jgi:hypothetical protein